MSRSAIAMLSASQGHSSTTVGDGDLTVGDLALELRPGQADAIGLL